MNSKKKILELLLNITKDNFLKNSTEDINTFLKYHKLDILDAIVNNYDFTQRQLKILRRKKIYLELTQTIAKGLIEKNQDFAFLKGIGLCKTFGEEYNWRYFSDIDILINYQTIPFIEELLFSNGFVYGFYQDKKIVEPAKQVLKHRKLFTHELFPMVKIVDGLPLYIDTNFLFSWKGITESNVSITEDEFFINKDEKNGTLNKLLNFVHLCVHFYNETVFFFLDEAYTDETQKDTKLFRLFDIIIQLSLFTTEDFENLKQLSEKYNANNQIKFVLKYIFELYGQDFLFESSNFFDFINTNVNYYYSKNGIKIQNNCKLFDIFYKNK